MPTTTTTQGRPDVTPLTAREREVLHALGCGLDDAEIADTLGLPVPMVAAQLEGILRKLGLRNRAAAIVHAFDRGLVVPGLGPADTGRHRRPPSRTRRPHHGCGSPCSARCGSDSPGAPSTSARSASRPSSRRWP